MTRTAPRITLPLLGTLALAAAPAVADSVTLKSSVRLGPDARVVRLGDIAELDGPLALAHADLVVADREDTDRLIELSIADVRRTLDDAAVHWGKVHLTGRRTVVRPAPASLAETPQAMVPTTLVASTDPSAARPRTAGPATPATELVGQATVGGEIARSVVDHLQRPAEDVRVHLHQDDAPILAAPIGDRRVELEPLSSLEGDRYQVAVRLWSGNRVVERHRIGIEVHVRVDVLTAVADLPRGHVLGEADLQPRTQWLSAQLAAVSAAPAEAIGRRLVRRLKPGDALRRSDLEQPVLVRRGDLVTVRCLVGGLVVTMRAEAREDGGEGDLVPCRKLGERDTFLAAVTAAGEVIVDLSRR
ncbi:MAG: flagellar basal body P-ring formation chaperone FlgA [Planctomycetota bacterium]